MRKFKILVCFTLIICLFISCSVFENYSGNITKLKWIMMGEKSKDHDMVMQGVNEYLKDKINVSLNIEFIPESQYTDRVKEIIANNEKFDIMWTSSLNGTFSYYGVENSFMDITELLNTYGQHFDDIIPNEIWKGVNYSGRVYGVPTYKNSTINSYFMFDKEYVDKYNLNYKEATQIELLDSTLKTIKENEKNISPLMLTKDGYNSLFEGYDLVISSPPIGVKIDNNLNLEIANPYMDDDVLSRLKILNSWYNQGVINSDAPHLDNYKSAPIVSAVNGHYSYDKEFGASFNKTYLSTPQGKGYYTNNSVRESVNVISKNSKNASKALQLLVAINTQSKLRNMLAYGLEGVHYKMLDNSTIEILNNDYKAEISQQGTYFNLYTFSPFEKNRWEEVKKENKSAKVSPILGFLPNLDEVKDEIDECSKIYKKWAPYINTGSQTSIETIIKMMSELEAAGYNKIINFLQLKLYDFISKGK